MASNAFARSSRTGSLTVGVVSGARLIWTKSYGDADAPGSRAATQDTVYRIGSITKMFTATMLEQLVDEGKVQLNDPVEKYFPEVNEIRNRAANVPPVTLLQLATHTGGLSREPDPIDPYVSGQPEAWKETLVKALPHVRYESKPGERFSYSNVGYAVLGAALEQAAHQPYLEYLPEHIFEPLGMTHTSLVLTPEIKAQLAKGYEMQRGTAFASAAQSDLENKMGRGYKVPNGAIYTTVGDMAKFASFLLGKGPDEVLTPQRLLYDHTHYIVPAQIGEFGGYGLGTMFIRRGKHLTEGHDGAVSGFHATLLLNREADVAVIVLCSALGNRAVDATSLAISALDALSK